MIVLGLGSNLGDRIENLRRGLVALKQLPGLHIQQVSPLYLSDALLPPEAPEDWNQSYINAAIRCESNLDPFVLLDHLKKIEWTIGTKPKERHWGPRILDIDLLVWDDKEIVTDKLTLPHPQIQNRPFVLFPLTDVAPSYLFHHINKTAAELCEQWPSRFSGAAPFRTRQIQQRIDTPQLVGIVNVTPNSFSDGGDYFEPAQAAQHAFDLVTAGAEILDIGAESTAPRAQLLTATEEWSRLEPVLKLIAANKARFLLPPKMSIDTRHVEVAKKALQYGIHWINDVSSLSDPGMCELIVDAQATCVIMHHLTLPSDPKKLLARNQDVFKAVFKWGEDTIYSLEKMGMTKNQIIFDPGIGFGKAAEQSLALIQQAECFTALGTKLLLGPSRKSFFSFFTDVKAKDRDVETTALVLALANKPIDYLRVHNVDACARALKVFRSI